MPYRYGDANITIVVLKKSSFSSDLVGENNYLDFLNMLLNGVV